MPDVDWGLVLGALGLAFVAWGAYRAYRSVRSGSVQEAPNEEPERIGALSLAEAESAARELLQTGAPFEAVREPLLARDRSRLDALPRSAQSFFSVYAEVAGNGMRLSRASVAPWTKDPSYVRVGSDIDDAEVVVRASDDQVFVVEKDANSPDVSDPYVSVWHYVLEVATHGDV